MVEASGGQIAKVARELKLHDSSLGNWVREAREQAAGAPTATERAEIGSRSGLAPRSAGARPRTRTTPGMIHTSAVAYFSASHPKSV